MSSRGGAGKKRESVGGVRGRGSREKLRESGEGCFFKWSRRALRFVVIVAAVPEASKKRHAMKNAVFAASRPSPPFLQQQSDAHWSRRDVSVAFGSKEGHGESATSGQSFRRYLLAFFCFAGGGREKKTDTVNPLAALAIEPLSSQTRRRHPLRNAVDPSVR